MNVKKCMCWCLSIIELKNAPWNIEIRCVEVCLVCTTGRCLSSLGLYSEICERFRCLNGKPNPRGVYRMSIWVLIQSCRVELWLQMITLIFFPGSSTYEYRNIVKDFYVCQRKNEHGFCPLSRHPPALRGRLRKLTNSHSLGVVLALFFVYHFVFCYVYFFMLQGARAVEGGEVWECGSAGSGLRLPLPVSILSLTQLRWGCCSSWVIFSEKWNAKVYVE